jgi:hypothetical protein
MIGFSEIRENSIEHFYDVIAEKNDQLNSKKRRSRRKRDPLDPTCPRCGGDASISFGTVEFSTLGFHLKWGRLCKACAEELQRLIIHPLK